MENLNIFYTLIFILSMLHHIYTDIRQMLLYDSVNLVLLVIGCLRAYGSGTFFEAIIGGSSILFLMLLFYYLSHQGIGEGDVKLAGALGVWLGLKLGLLMLLLAFISGALGGGWLYLRHKVNLREPIPFGPFLCISAISVYFFGMQILKWYWKLVN